MSTTKFAEFLVDRGVVYFELEIRRFLEGRFFFQRPGSRACARARPPARVCVPVRAPARARACAGKPDKRIFWSDFQIPDNRILLSELANGVPLWTVSNCLRKLGIVRNGCILGLRSVDVSGIDLLSTSIRVDLVPVPLGGVVA